MKTFYVNDILNKSDHLELLEFINSYLDSSKFVKYSKPHGRYFDFVNLPQEMLSKLLDIARDRIGDSSLDLVYCQVVKYQILDEVKPRLKQHKDNLYCTHIFNITLDSTIPWDLDVEGKLFPSVTNSAVFLKGDEETHGRPDFPSESPEDFVLSLFLHLAPEGDDNLNKARKFRELSEESQRLLLSKLIPVIYD